MDADGMHDGWIPGYIDGLLDARVDRRMHGQSRGLVHAWMYAWVDGRTEALMDRCVDRWTSRSTPVSISHLYNAGVGLQALLQFLSSVIPSVSPAPFQTPAPLPRPGHLEHHTCARGLWNPFLALLSACPGCSRGLATLAFSLCPFVWTLCPQLSNWRCSWAFSGPLFFHRAVC